MVRACTTAPALRIRSASGDVVSATSSIASDPYRIRHPRTGTSSLSATGRPSSGRMRAPSRVAVGRRARRRQRLLVPSLRERVHAGLHRFGTADHRLQQLDGREVLRPHGGQGIRGGEAPRFVHPGTLSEPQRFGVRHRRAGEGKMGHEASTPQQQPCDRSPPGRWRRIHAGPGRWRWRLPRPRSRRRRRTPDRRQGRRSAPDRGDRDLRRLHRAEDLRRRQRSRRRHLLRAGPGAGRHRDRPGQRSRPRDEAVRERRRERRGRDLGTAVRRLEHDVPAGRPDPVHRHHADRVRARAPRRPAPSTARPIRRSTWT